jgi:hypothetical protein
MNGLQFGDRLYSSIRPNVPPGFRGAFQQHDGHIDVFACTSCGYIELYAGDPNTLGYITQTWEPVEATASPMPPPPPPNG